MRNESVSDFLLERFVLGESSTEEAGVVTQTAAADPRVRAALDDIERSNRDILSRYPAAEFTAGLLARLKAAGAKPSERQQRGMLPAVGILRPRWVAIASAAAALVLVAVLIIPGIVGRREGRFPGRDLEPGVIKGEGVVDLGRTQLLVYQKKDNEAAVLADGARAETGALLQLAYVSGGESYGVILSIDGSGAVTRHFPQEETGPTRLDGRQRSLLPTAFELDNAPGFERFFLITSATPVDVGGVLARAEELARSPSRARVEDLDLPPGFKQHSVLILKGRGSK